MNWNPQTLFHCVDSTWLGWLNIVLSIGVVGLYIAITFTTWLPAMRGASKGAARSMGLMAAIFIFCALAGYGTLALAGFSPKTAFILRTVSLIALNIVCPWFLLSKANQDFVAIGRQQSVGMAVLSANIENKSDAELVQMVRSACKLPC